MNTGWVPKLLSELNLFWFCFLNIFLYSSLSGLCLYSCLYRLLFQQHGHKKHSKMIITHVRQALWKILGLDWYWNDVLIIWAVLGKQNKAGHLEYISNLKREHSGNKFNFFTHKNRLSEIEVIFLIVSINYIYSGCIYLPSASQNFTVCFVKKFIAYLIWLKCNLMVGNKMHLILWGSSSNYKMTNHWQMCCRNRETKMIIKFLIF